MAGLILRKHADKTTSARVVRYDPETGAKKLVNPDTPGEEHEPWPLAGISIENTPDVARLSTTLVEQGKAEGWLSTTGDRVVVRPAGPAGDPLADRHTFVHYDTITFHTLDGDIVFRVTHQPDKYADHSQATYPEAVEAFEGDDETPVTPTVYAAGATRVDWFYDVTVTKTKKG